MLWQPYVFAAPYFILYLAFNLFPIIFTFFISLTDWTGLNDRHFVGLANYAELITADPNFWKAISNTLILYCGFFPLNMILGLILAVCLHSTLTKGRRFLQIAYFLPYITTPVAIGLIFSLLFDKTTGLVNRILLALIPSFSAIDWLGTPVLVKVLVIIIVFWRYGGYYCIFYMAGISNISPDLYEAADIDGANAFQKFFRITVPQLRSTIFFLFITQTIGSLQILEEPMLLVTNWTNGGVTVVGGVDRTVLTAVWYLYDTSFVTTNNFGKGSAVSYLLFLVIAILTFLFMTITRRKNQEA